MNRHGWSEWSPADRYRATCVHCGADVVVAARFADPEFALMQQHLATAHSELGNAGETVRILQHYTVSAHPVQ